MARGLLIVTMEPPAGMEEEFNDWYDLEHFPQRSSLPGFTSASRWICLDGWPRYLAVYDMASPDAVSASEYRAVSGANSTPWSKRVLGRTIGRQRHVGIAVGDQPDQQCVAPDASRLLAASWTCTSSNVTEFANAVRSAAATLPDAAQSRLFAVEKGETVLLWLFVAFDAPVALGELKAVAKVAGRGAGTCNLYAPYFRMSGY